MLAAARELEEETGYHSENLTHLLSLRTTVAFCNEKIEMIEKRILVLSGDQAEGTKDDGQF